MYCNDPTGVTQERHALVTYPLQIIVEWNAATREGLQEIELAHIKPASVTGKVATKLRSFQTAETLCLLLPLFQERAGNKILNNNDDNGNGEAFLTEKLGVVPVQERMKRRP